eukprot:SAG31_NODE_7499_length_1670_cov_4.351369_1_plen_46_part_10
MGGRAFDRTIGRRKPLARPLGLAARRPRRPPPPPLTPQPGDGRAAA